MEVPAQERDGVTAPGRLLISVLPTRVKWAHWRLIEAGR